MHATTAGFEALVSACVIADLEAMCWPMGGHGFGAFAGIWRSYMDSVPRAT